MNFIAEDGGRRLDTALRLAAWGGAALLFLAAVAAEQVWAEMAWTTFDFAFWAGVLLAGCAAFELTMRVSPNWSYRLGAGIATGAALLLLVASGAVGVIGGEDEPANLLYLGVLALGIGGAFSAEFKPRGLARAASLMAVSTILIGVLAVARGWGAGAENSLLAVVGATVFFAGAWLLSAWLLRRTAREQGAA